VDGVKETITDEAANRTHPPRMAPTKTPASRQVPLPLDLPLPGDSRLYRRMYEVSTCFKTRFPTANPLISPVIKLIARCSTDKVLTLAKGESNDFVLGDCFCGLPLAWLY
jgi:hypothetical protein